LEIAELLGADFQPADWQRWSRPEGTVSVQILFGLRIRTVPCPIFGNGYMFFFVLDGIQL